MFKRILFFILFIFILITGSLFFILNSPVFMQKAIPYIVNRSSKNINISELEIGEQSLDLSAAFKLSDLDLKALIGKDEYDITLGAVRIEQPGLFTLSKNKLSILLNDLSLFSKDITIKNASINMASVDTFPKIEPVKGTFTVERVKYMDYKASHLEGDLTADLKKCFLKNIQGQLYGGSLGGEIVLDYKDKLSYIVKVTLKNVDLKLLGQVQPMISSNVKGIIDGNLNVSGDIDGNSRIKGSIWAVKGGEVKASLLRLLLNYIPESAQKKEVDALIKSGGNLPLDSAAVNIDTASDNKLLTKVKLTSKKVNLDINLEIELNIEGGIKNIFNIQKQVF